ncbi:hypothetical protein MSG28_009213 [Choristoneura fumiferana]|uniref:Uncharacterized protein n=1 Tax=Choristoneura fumiferana TaxID=7141 RepID=A0ACC0KXA3_CHOFU|nr:hypothetical protein MSG28_009213 [Choristoneura fumiferana]
MTFTVKENCGKMHAFSQRAGNASATSLEEQITVGGEKSSSGDHEPEDEALAGLPPGGLTTSQSTAHNDSIKPKHGLVTLSRAIRSGPIVVYLTYILASAIYCYYCNSANNSACLDLNEMNDETRARIIPVVDCATSVMQPVAGDFFCRKIIQTSKCINKYCYGNSISSTCFYFNEMVEKSRIYIILNCDIIVMQSTVGNFFCRKIIQTIYNSRRENEVRVTRGCGWIRSDKPCYRADNSDHLETVCQCFHDHCNSGEMVSSETAVVLFLFFSGVLYLYR